MLTIFLEPSFDFFYDDPSHFQEFENFLDSVGLPAGWTPPVLGHQVETSQTLQANHESGQPDHTPPIPTESRSGSPSPFGSWLPSVPQDDDDQALGSMSDRGMRSFFLWRDSPEMCTTCMSVAIRDLTCF